jgi:UDP-hydrolysing UDP-N-acetyl-D-glucosamine 2-epimerase
MHKIAVVIASRANWGRLKSVCKAIQDHPQLELQIITAASACELPIESDAKIQCLLIDGDNTEAMALTTGVFLTQIAGVLSRLKPDMVLVHADRYEVLAAAIAASYMNIPLCHTEGGEKSGTIDDKVRNAISKLADIHFPVTKEAETKLVQMGCNNVFTVGSTALDTIKDIDLTNSRDKPYIVILHHPNTTDPEDITPLIGAIKCLPYHKVWVNPNVDAGNKAMLKLIHQQEVEFVKNLPPEEYARLIYNCNCLVGNTSSGIKEGAFFGVPYVCVGNRQLGREKGHNTISTNMHTFNIILAVTAQLKHGRHEPDYRFGTGDAGEQIAERLASL